MDAKQKGNYETIGKMTHSIPKTLKNIAILHSLVSNGHYEGLIKPTGFELKRKHFPNNFGIIGTLNNDEWFQVKSDYVKRLKYFAQFLNIIGIVIAIGLIFIKSNWIIAIIYFMFRLISHAYFKVKSEEGLSIFSSKFLKMKKMLGE
ncbi:hypothetical protein L0P88_11905 [Muricauda sp. SCSIO 64092]|uniref:hypothetical protein n=1 Tax=Allomuricauda sp. SCSIO 64092 TaxID=2908842 RepID=UPI001FF42C70|nr:hypothetical protein [Muricauda sp. SCSIO 64092]UOY09216.1 hypothetical protein L0P88_11905 [Muricauda sp. SCSIO 64092]